MLLCGPIRMDLSHMALDHVLHSDLISTAHLKMNILCIAIMGEYFLSDRSQRATVLYPIAWCGCPQPNDLHNNR